MTTMAEIERAYPERLAALNAVMGGTVSFTEAEARFAAGLELYRATLSATR